MFEKANFGHSFLIFFDGPAKNQQAYVSEKCPKNTLEVSLDNVQKITKKMKQLSKAS